MNLVNTSYSKDDVEILLQDVKGKVPVLDTLEREKLNKLMNKETDTTKENHDAAAESTE